MDAVPWRQGFLELAFEVSIAGVAVFLWPTPVDLAAATLIGWSCAAVCWWDDRQRPGRSRQRGTVD